MSSFISILTNEVTRLHEFFVDWFTGKLERSDEMLQSACISYFHEDLHFIPPAGIVLSREQLLERLKKSHRTRDKDFEINIHNVQVLQELSSETTFLISYQEWQRHQQMLTARLTTAILEITASKKVLWRHVHETWIDGKSPADNTAIGKQPGIHIPTASIKPNENGNFDKTKSAENHAPSPLISRRRHISPQLPNFGARPILRDHGCMAGIVLREVQVVTLQGTIASDSWLTSTSNDLEALCQYKNSTTAFSKRRLLLPEMVFDKAIVKIVLPDNVSIEWTATGALQEWAKAHQAIPVGATDSHNGVSVLKALDAQLWSTKKEATTEFHYDWSFSTPYLQTGGTNWIPLKSSGMNQGLLLDTSQPILYFDENQLYEDDMHDNGVVSFRIKTRVMPTCVFILSRLWLRVDGVVLRVKETRIMVEFGSLAVHRDVLWRECHWEKLKNYSLPTDVRAWRNEDGVETAAWQGLINRLPQVSLPVGIPQFAKLEYR